MGTPHRNTAGYLDFRLYTSAVTTELSQLIKLLKCLLFSTKQYQFGRNELFLGRHYSLKRGKKPNKNQKHANRNKPMATLCPPCVILTTYDLRFYINTHKVSSHNKVVCLGHTPRCHAEPFHGPLPNVSVRFRTPVHYHPQGVFPSRASSGSREAFCQISR